MTRRPEALLAVCAALLLGCRSTTVGERVPSVPPPVESLDVRTPDDVVGWGYRQVGESDLNGDGGVERVVLAADVELADDSSPLWRDGHRWAAYVEDASGERTLLYSAFLPHGFVQAALMAPDAEGRRHLLLQERSPARIRLLQVAYLGPGSAVSVPPSEYHITDWLIDPSGSWSRTGFRDD